MDNYYEILGLTNTADATQIRAAYKRLALKYHPDRNPGFPEAEEIFKSVNEAYHTLSDPLKRLTYDSRFVLPRSVYDSDYKREIKRRRYWYYFLKNQDRPYKLDKEYFKIQGLAFLVFIVISGFCFALVHTANYWVERQHLKKWEAINQSLKKVNALFGSGNYDDAFTLIQALKKDDPYEFRFIYARDSLMTEFKGIADSLFNKKDFAEAVTYYRTLEHYEEPTRFETLRKISLCQYYLGNYAEAVQALKHLHHQQPRNLELVYEIGIINLDYLNNVEEAWQYFTLGKKLFKENLSEVYGEAFELMVNPPDVPDIYFSFFEGRGRCNLALQRFDDAITDGNWAVFLRPENGIGYYMRAQAYGALFRHDKACKDLIAARMRGISATRQLEREHCHR